MRVIPKTEVSQHLMLDTLAKLHRYKRKKEEFEKKYNCSFKQFEKKISSTRKENFEHWDDYIEWKAFESFYSSLNSKLTDLKNGNFKVA